MCRQFGGDFGWEVRVSVRAWIGVLKVMEDEGLLGGGT